jgi:hypothetical protein
VTRRQTERLFTEWQARLGLHEWRLRFSDVDHEDLDDDDQFDVRVRSHSHYRWANLLVTRRWRVGSTIEEATPTVIHELLHLALRQLVAAAEVCSPSDESAAGLHDWMVCQAEEVAVDRLSYALAEAWACR